MLVRKAAHEVAGVELELCLRTVIASVDDDGPKKLGQQSVLPTTVPHVGQHLCVEGLARKESIGRPKHDVKVDGAPSAGRRKRCDSLELQGARASRGELADWIWGLVARKKATYVVGTCVQAAAPTFISSGGDI